MTEKQQELYIKTKARLRRMGAENPADVIVALAEEIDYYREKIHAMEEFIAKRERKHGNETTLVAELRNKQSRDNRDLLDRAADRIEELEASQHKQSEWISVDERLPEECNNVLCFARNKTMIAFMEKVEDCGEYVPVFWDWVAYDRDDTYDEVCATHWMPLPEAPKGGAE